MTSAGVTSGAHSITSSARVSWRSCVALTIACPITVDFPLGRIVRFGSISSLRSNAGKPRTSSP